jgi:hypothetical protein
VGKTFKDRKKFERKHDRADGFKEPKRESKRDRRLDESEDIDLYEYDDDE